MATAGPEEGIMETEDGQEAVSAVVLPHLEYGIAEMDILHPKVEIIEPEVLDDSAEPQDPILEHGYRLAKTIQLEMHQTGRTRRSPTTTPTTTTTTTTTQHQTQAPRR